MKCFVHINQEAVAVCKKCGKAMCGECSAYSNHRGICPECRRSEFIAERDKLFEERTCLKEEVFWCVVKAIFLFWLLLIPVLVNCIKISNRKKRIAKIDQRVLTLTNEIEKLTKALENKGVAFE